MNFSLFGSKASLFLEKIQKLIHYIVLITSTLCLYIGNSLLALFLKKKVLDYYLVPINCLFFKKIKSTLRLLVNQEKTEVYGIEFSVQDYGKHFYLSTTSKSMVSI